MEEVDKWRTIESLIAGLSEIAREIKEIEAETNDEHTSDEKCKEAGLPPNAPESMYNAVMKSRNAQAKKQQELETYGNNEWLDANPDAANEYISNWGINKGINKSGYKYNPNAQTDEELLANRQYDAWVEQELNKETSKSKKERLRKQYYMSPEERNAALLEQLKKQNTARAERDANKASNVQTKRTEPVKQTPLTPKQIQYKILIDNARTGEEAEKYRKMAAAEGIEIENPYYSDPEVDGYNENPYTPRPNRNDGLTSDETCKTSYVGLLGPRKEKH